MPNDRLFLIDAHALCYRSFYAGMELSTSKGEATHAVLGFVNTVRKILRDYQPTYMAVCFDSPHKTFRAEKFSDYKIQRPSMPEDLIRQIVIIKEVVKAYRLAMFEVKGHEADDIIATLAKRFSKDNKEVVIVSEDKDMYQLADGHIKFLSAREDAMLGYEELKKKLGFDPHLFADFVGLAGDKVDNIPGVEGIGGVGARQLINTHGSLEDILDYVQGIECPKKKEKLILTQKEIAVLSKELAVLETHVPLAYDVQDLRIQSPDKNRLFELFRDLEFKKLAGEYSSDEKKSVEVHTVKTEKAAIDLLAQIRTQGLFAFFMDTEEEEDLLSPRHLFIALDEHKVYGLSLDYLESLRPLFQDQDILKITYNLKKMLQAFSFYNIDIKGKVFDIMLAGYLLNPATVSFKLDDLVWSFFKGDLSGNNQSADAAHFLHRLHPLMCEHLQERSLMRLLEDIEVPLSYVLFKMEACGVNLNLGLLNQLSRQCDQDIQGLSKKLYEQAGGPFNLNSPKQLSHVLFDTLNLPVIKKTKTGFSTNESVLTVLAKKHAFPALILEYRQLAKLKSTYIDALPKLVTTDGRIHAEFDQTGTETGRLSSRKPNLQNIPVRTDMGRQIRRAFIPSSEDNILIAADYSQIELRILAHLSGDDNLVQAFLTDQDIHQYTASLMFLDQNEIKEEITPEQRNAAKRVNFGIIYGMGAFSLAKDLHVTPEEAQTFIDTYFARYPQVKKFMDQIVKKCEEERFVSTFLNRRRYIPEINSSNMSVQQFARRQAINTVVQGSAADLIKLAMVNIQKALEEEKMQSKMIITVHDELVFDVPIDEKENIIPLIKKHMETPLELSVPIKVSMKAGKNWLEMEKI